MYSRARLQRISRVGIIFATCIITLFLISLNWDFGYINTFGISFENGAICIIPSVSKQIYTIGGLTPGFSIEPIRSEVGWLASLLYVDVEWWPRTITFTNVAQFIYIPLWMPLVISLIPFCVYRLKYKTQTGHCKQCNYDLTGNESGTCPECGTTIPK